MKSVSALVGEIKSGRTTATCIMECIQNNIAGNGHLNAFISLNPDAVKQARDLDRRIGAGQYTGRLAGIPISIKDNICTRGYRTTCGSRMLECHIPEYDATAVRRLLDEDAILVGKTNMDEFGMGSTTEFSAYGPVLNPRDTSRVPGGSSGGSAASVAAGMALVSLGSDTGGSIRNPASFCGVVGFKPTYGMVSRYGLVSYSNSVEQIGPLTRSVDDALLALDIIRGIDTHDNTTVQHAPRGRATGRVAVIEEMVPDSMDSSISGALHNAISALESHDMECQRVSIPSVEYSVAAYYTITSTEAASNLARYDNIRYGYELDHSGYEFHRYITKARERFGPETRRRIIAGGFASSAGYAGRYYNKARSLKAKLTAEIDRLFCDYDYVVSPTVPFLPFRLGEMTSRPVEMFRADINTITANLAGKPAVSVPYASHDGLPIGMQLMSDSGWDVPLLETARILEGGYDRMGGGIP